MQTGPLSRGRRFSYGHALDVRQVLAQFPARTAQREGGSVMYTPEDSPFEKFRTEKLKGVAMSPDVLELVAKAYECGFIDGMQKQMQSSVDRAVNRMAEQAEQAQPVVTAPCKGMNCGCTDGLSHSLECQAEHAAAIAGGVFVKAEQAQPVAWWDEKLGVFDEKHFDQLQPLYTAPPPRHPWIGLTPEERADLRYEADIGPDAIIKATEAKLKEKNK
jgi:hypothetical protein